MTARSGIVAGLVAGIVFLIVELVLVPTVGGGALWGPPRMMAAIALGPEVLPPPTFDAGVVFVAMLVHFGLSAVLGVIFALLAGKFTLSRNNTILAGIAFGLLVYLVNFYGFTEVFPWFAMARNWITVVAHLIFGGVLAWWLVRRRV